MDADDLQDRLDELEKKYARVCEAIDRAESVGDYALMDKLSDQRERLDAKIERTKNSLCRARNWEEWGL